MTCKRCHNGPAVPPESSVVQLCHFCIAECTPIAESREAMKARYAELVAEYGYPRRGPVPSRLQHI